jgi:hypothetical protein
MAEEMTAVMAIKKYFFAENEPVSRVLAEIKNLTPEDRKELAEGAAKQLGVTLKASAA